VVRGFACKHGLLRGRIVPRQPTRGTSSPQRGSRELCTAINLALPKSKSDGCGEDHAQIKWHPVATDCFGCFRESVLEALLAEGARAAGWQRVAPRDMRNQIQRMPAGELEGR